MCVCVYLMTEKKEENFEWMATDTFYVDTEFHVA